METSSNLVRLFGVLKAIVELGPAATADRDFSESAYEVLRKALQAFDAVQGALLAFDTAGVRLTSVAGIGLPPLDPGASITIGRKESQRWSQTRESLVVKGTEGIEFFGGQSSELLSSVRCITPLRMGSGLVGALLLGSRLNNGRYGDVECEGLNLLAGHLAMMVQNHTLVVSLRNQIADNLRLLSNLDHSFDDALEAFATTIDAKDKHMRGHSMRVGRYSSAIASSLGMGDADIQSLRAAGQLHDIGRVTVDKAVSNKPSSLRPEEFQEIADHTVMGHQIVSSVRFPWKEVPEVVRWHHERSDGSGYPDSLHLDETPLPVRIVAVADSFDAMTSDRPWRKGMTILQTADELVRLSPAKFDPDVVQAMLVQLRCSCQGKGDQRLALGQRANQISVPDIDRLSVQLVNRMTNYRVYSA